MKHLRFPEAHGCQAQCATRCQAVQCFPFPARELVRAKQPPDPHMCVEQDRHRDASNALSSSTDSPGSASSSPEPRSRSQGLRGASATAGGGASRATTLPRRLMSIASPPASTRRMSFRQLARKRVTEMSIRGSYMDISSGQRSWFPAGISLPSPWQRPWTLVDSRLVVSTTTGRQNRYPANAGRRSSRSCARSSRRPPAFQDDCAALAPLGEGHDAAATVAQAGIRRQPRLFACLEAQS